MTQAKTVGSASKKRYVEKKKSKTFNNIKKALITKFKTRVSNDSWPFSHFRDTHMLDLDFYPSHVGSPNHSPSLNTPPGCWRSGPGEKVFTLERACSGQRCRCKWSFVFQRSCFAQLYVSFWLHSFLNKASQAEITTNMVCNKKLDFTVVAAAGVRCLNSAGPVTWGYVVCSFCLMENVIGCWSMTFGSSDQTCAVSFNYHHQIWLFFFSYWLQRFVSQPNRRGS